MSLSTLLLALLLFLMAAGWLGWFAVSGTFLGIVALLTALFLLLEGTTVVSWKVPVRRV